MEMCLLSANIQYILIPTPMDGFFQEQTYPGGLITEYVSISLSPSLHMKYDSDQPNSFREVVLGNVDRQ